MVEGKGLANATARVAAFLGHEPAALRFALAARTRKADAARSPGAPSPGQARYADYLFLLAAAAPDWYPRLWPSLARYVAAARARADPALAA